MKRSDTKRLNGCYIIPILLIFFSSCHSGSGSLEGIITDAYTGKPIQGVEISISGSPQPVSTDSSGYFLIKDLSPDSVPVTFRKTGYQPKTITDMKFRDSVNNYLETDLKPLVDWISSDTMTVKSVSINELSIYFTDKKIQGSPDSIIRLFYNENNMRSKSAIAKLAADRRKAIEDLMAKQRGVIAVSGSGYSNTINFYREKGKKSQYKDGSSDYSTSFTKRDQENTFILAEADSRSTFDMDIRSDDYLRVRDYIHNFQFPPRAAIRTEEFINYFSYAYPPPTNGDFSVVTMSSTSVLNKNCQLVRIGIQAKTSDVENRAPASLTFVININGSANINNRLGLLKKSLHCLAEQLHPEDKMGIVTYGTHGSMLLEHTHNRDSILNFVRSLENGCAVPGDTLLRNGYSLALKYFDQEKINRIIYCTDGTYHDGWTESESILNEVDGFRQQDISLSVYGFVVNYYNIDPFKKMVHTGGGNLVTITDYNQAKHLFLGLIHRKSIMVADNITAHVEFDKKAVNRYRLIGYEKWDMLDDEMLMDNRSENNGIGLGHSVTVLYEVELKDSSVAEIGKICLKWNVPGKGKASELSETIRIKKPSVLEADEFQLMSAAVLFAEKLRAKYWNQGESIDDVIKILQGLSPGFRKTHPDFSDFAEMVYRTKMIENSEYDINDSGK